MFFLFTSSFFTHLILECDSVLKYLVVFDSVPSNVAPLESEVALGMLELISMTAYRQHE